MDKESRKKIVNLKRQKRYDEIYTEFGVDVYNRNTPKSYKKKDFKKLAKEGRYEVIFNKYGEKEYKKLLYNAQYKEIKEARGTVSALLWKAKQKFKKQTRSTLIALTATLGVGSALMANNVEETINENAITYQSEIESYNNKIDKYAEDVKAMNLNDVQTFMKVMDDMWGSIQGYKKPEKNIVGFAELDLATPNGYGVCRNMASDIAEKLNAIKPEYNARTMVVEMGENGNYELANIHRTILEEDDTVKEDENNEEQDDKILTKIMGNHMVTFVDVKEDNLTVVLDPTNPGIGIYKNGGITMLNAKDETKIKYYPKNYIDAIFNKGGIESFGRELEEISKSFELAKISREEIQEKYGVDAQNKALEEVRQESKDDKDEIEEEYKVDKNALEEKGDYNLDKDINHDSNIKITNINKENER